LYEVSSTGSLKRLASKVRNGNGLVARPERIIPPTISNGYHVVNLWHENRPTRWLLHRLVAAAFLGRSDLSVDHINGVCTDNRLDNLRYCTLEANTLFQHAAGRVRFVRGVENGKSKLTEAKVRQARSLIASGRSLQSVASELGVSKGAIQAMREGRTWGHVL
jgi:hypothetical protein